MSSKAEARSDTNGKAATSPAYYVPALEKGLDVLECLASQGVPMTQAQLARALGRGASELFRILTTLERRGYIVRDPESGAYGLTLRLFELAHAHSPYEGLMRAATRPMRELTTEIRESCHISVIHRGRCLVLAEEPSPSRVRVSVEVGSTIALHQAASGRLLLAALDAARRQELFDSEPDLAQLPASQRQALEMRLQRIRERGYEDARGDTVEGVSDLAVLIGELDAPLHAALTVTALPRDHAAFVQAVLPPLRHCADAIARAAGLGHRQSSPGA
ncbi:MAG: hypothetical protein C4346_11075 [Chloroflexota bacterium]